MMSRKDFAAIAEILRLYKINCITKEETLRISLISQDLAGYFKKANPTFDRGKFLRACGFYQE